MKKFFLWQHSKRIVRVGFFFLVGCITAVLIIQEDPWLKWHLKQQITAEFCQLYDCQFSCVPTSLHVLSGTLELRSLAATGKKTCDWSWQADKVTVHWSWLDLIWYGHCGLHVTMEGLTGNSQVRLSDGWCAIAHHLQLLAAPTELAIPCELVSFFIRNGMLRLTTDEHNNGYTIGCSFASDSFIALDIFRSALRFSQGFVVKNGKQLIENASGSSFIFLPTTSNNSITDRLTLLAQADFSQLPDAIQQVRLQAEWQAGEGVCHITNADDSLQGICSLEKNHLCNGLFTIPLIYIDALIHTTQSLNVQGALEVDFTADIQDFVSTLKARAVAQDVIYAGTEIPPLFATVDGEHEQLKGTVTIGADSDCSARGSWSFDTTHSYLTGEVALESLYKLPGPWDLQEGAVSLYGDIGLFNNLSGDFSGTLVHRKSKKQDAVAGSCSLHQGRCLIDGLIGEKSVECIFGLKPDIYCDFLRYQDGGTDLIEGSGSPDGSFQGYVDYLVLRDLIKLTGSDLPGEGKLVINGNYANKKLSAHFAIDDASIRVPLTYSIIKKIAGKVAGDLSTGIYNFIDTSAELYKGHIVCSRATVWVDEDGMVSFLHCPLMLHSCFLSWKKELFAQVSGALVVGLSQQEAPRIEGQLVIDQSHVRGNVLSAEFQQDFFGNSTDSLVTYMRDQVSDDARDCELALSIITRSLIEIKTPFLQSTAKCALQVGGSLNDIHLSGTIDLLSGVLGFPYKPLFITQGKITFIPQCLEDPSIELIARNSIKNYAVELQVSGSAQVPKVSFSANPYLSRDQIITLLFGGSDDGSLSLVMPRLITDTLEHLLFGSAETSSRVQKYLKSLFKPLKGIRIIPNVSDQKGRGGVRGSVAFEVNDRLNAKFEKNFSLTEDVAYEVEYLISDDSSVHLVKDERGDVGLEGQMRWKF